VYWSYAAFSKAISAEATDVSEPQGGVSASLELECIDAKGMFRDRSERGEIECERDDASESAYPDVEPVPSRLKTTSASTCIA
jgi:hypothetical protein